MPKIAIVAGEPSGDLIASQLMSDLKKFDKNIEFIGVGGPRMEKIGLASLFDFSILSVMGIIDVLKNIKKLYFCRKKLIDFLIKEKPSVFIGIDSPDFNFYVEKKLKKNGTRVFHLISPSVWAWRKYRIYSIKKVMHHLFCVFPHEPKIYKKINHPSSFVGHSLASTIPYRPNVNKSRAKLKVDGKRKVIGLLPGSREHEIKYLLDLMLDSAELISNKIDCEFLISASNNYNYIKIKNALFKYKIPKIRLIIGHSHDLINASDILLCASGTVTLEAALYKKPMIITYRSSWIEFHIYKLVRLIKYIGLPNILLNREIVPEFLQDNVSPEILANKAIDILSDKKYNKLIKKQFIHLHKVLKKDTSRLIFQKIKPFL